MTAASSSELARRIRAHALRMVHRSRSSHIGSCLSCADILAVLYADVLRHDPTRPDWPERDWFIDSKGHGAAILYAVLAERGFFPVEQLEDYTADGSPLFGHVTHGVPGVEHSTGSLGHGLPVGAGLALGLRGGPQRVFVLLSDGECDEGSTWEAALFAPHHRLENLVAVVDYNKIQSFGAVADVLGLEPFADKWRSFGWTVREIDGHDHEELRTALTAPPGQGRPTLVLAHTIKGKGVDFMEGQLAFHYRPPKDDELARALEQVGDA